MTSRSRRGARLPAAVPPGSGRCRDLNWAKAPTTRSASASSTSRT